MRALKPLDIRQNCRATAEETLQSEPFYSTAFARTMLALTGNVGFSAFHSAGGIDHQRLKMAQGRLNSAMQQFGQLSKGKAD